jgi:hypothetical protein
VLVNDPVIVHNAPRQSQPRKDKIRAWLPSMEQVTLRL